MRVLIVHYRYFVSGGPERYLFNVKRVLEEHGHEIVPFSIGYRRNEESEWARYFARPIAGDDEAYYDEFTWTPRSTVRALKASFYSPETRRSLSRLLRDARPDVALVLQYLRWLSPSILSALRAAGVPVVQRLSDFEMVCPEAHLTRDGEPCERCVGRLPFPSVRYRCVHGSRVASGVELMARACHRGAHLFDAVDTFVAPTPFMREMMVLGGWPSERVRVIPTPVPSRPEGDGEGRDTLLYVGRIDRLKGVFVLIDAYAQLLQRLGSRAPKLVFVGDAEGPEGSELAARSADLGLGDRVVFAGSQDAQGVGRWLDKAILSVVPSICRDNLPNSLLESLAAGVPVIVSDQPTLREALGGSGAGSVVPVGDPAKLAVAIEEMLDDPERVAAAGRAARRLARERYSEEAHLDALTGLFDELIRSKRGGMSS